MDVVGNFDPTPGEADDGAFSYRCTVQLNVASALPAELGFAG